MSTTSHTENYLVHSSKKPPTEGEDNLTTSPHRFAEDEVWLSQVDECIQKNIANPNFTIGQLAIMVAVSERQLRRRMKQLLGKRPGQYVQQKRLERAYEFWRQRRYKTLQQLALSVGYRSSDSFRALFEKFYGVKI